MLGLLCRKLIPALLLLGSAGALHAQSDYLNLANHDDQPYYFGITLGYNQSYYKLEHADKFIHDDSVLLVEPLHSQGFNLGLLGNMRINKKLDLRFNPNLVFADKGLHYLFKTDSLVEDKNIPSILLSFPLQLKLKSDRIGNFRFYVIGGLKFDYDLAANTQARREYDIVKANKLDYGYEAGLGFEFYFPHFIFSPEIKLSNGFSNIQIREPENPYSNIIERLISRIIVFSIHLEG
ncbi:porin family protein [Compostibacter hankyongensis]|uniref:Outer membrane protein beta-barrel domain-containing protein n=1 Tax=Compostibacter hankyongensis TaxID=1007089 RepID=A0ABP8G8T3_9BACT